jgi:hypothetical protein
VCSFTVAIEPVLDELWENDVDMRTISHHVKYLFERCVMRCTLFFNTLVGFSHIMHSFQIVYVVTGK